MAFVYCFRWCLLHVSSDDRDDDSYSSSSSSVESFCCLFDCVSSSALFSMVVAGSDELDEDPTFQSPIASCSSDSVSLNLRCNASIRAFFTVLSCYMVSFWF